MSDSSTDSGNERLERNEYRAECGWCGTSRTARVASAYSITTEELADEQGLYCESCDDVSPHIVSDSVGDRDV